MGHLLTLMSFQIWKNVYAGLFLYNESDKEWKLSSSKK